MTLMLLWILNHVSRSITWCLFTLKNIKLGQMTTLYMIFDVVVSVYPLTKIWNSSQFPAQLRNGQLRIISHTLISRPLRWCWVWTARSHFIGVGLRKEQSYSLEPFLQRIVKKHNWKFYSPLRGTSFKTTHNWCQSLIDGR